MNDQITRDAEYCESMAATYREGVVNNESVSAALEIQAQRYDRLKSYAIKAAKTPQRELVELREENERLRAQVVSSNDLVQMQYERGRSDMLLEIKRRLDAEKREGAR